MRFFHTHVWELASIDCYDLGSKKIFRTCKKCGKVKTETIFPSHDISWNDIPKISKRKCIRKHYWEFIRNFYYIFDIGMDEVKCKVGIYACTKCGNIECRDVSRDLQKMTENYTYKFV